MRSIKLVKARSYTTKIVGLGIVRTTEKHPVISADDSEAERLIATGHFVAVADNSAEHTVEDTAGGNVPPAYGGKTLDEMNTSELETFATYKGVSFKGIKKRDDMVKKLREELPAEELEGIIEYGSPTMTELQDK